jgi:hypothetical protein
MLVATREAMIEVGGARATKALIAALADAKGF